MTRAYERSEFIHMSSFFSRRVFGCVVSVVPSWHPLKRGIKAEQAGVNLGVQPNRAYLHCGWTKSISHHLESMVGTMAFVGIYVGKSVKTCGGAPERWCEMK